MGDRFAGVRPHRRVIVLGAVVLLPLSTLAATASVASPGSTTTGVPSMSSAADGVSPGTYAAAQPAPNVSKVLPAGWTTAGGHTAVIVGTVKQRVAQVSAMSTHNVPLAALEAYKRAERSVASSSPGCHLSWTLLAAIGTVESDNGQYGGAVILTNGDTSPSILGPVLNGTGNVGAIRDTDGGRYDGDSVWDRAVGPMQFIPGTWAAYGADGNGDGVRDPNNIADAALGAANYLCAGGGDLRVQSQLRAAVMRYNYSVAYVNLVLSLARAYASGAATVIPNALHATTTRQAAPSDHGRDRAPVVPTKPGGERQQMHRGSGGQGDHGSGDHGHHGTGGGGGGTGGGGGGGGGGETGKTPSVHSPVHQPPTGTPPGTKPTPTGPGTGSPAQPIATGVLTTCKSGWCVGTTALDFGANADLTTRQGDLNGDGRTWSMERELRSLAGVTMTVTVVLPPTSANPDQGAAGSASATGTDAAGAGGAVPTAPATPAAPPADAARQADPVVAITVDADGIVTSINGVAYSAPPTTP